MAEIERLAAQGKLTSDTTAQFERRLTLLNREKHHLLLRMRGIQIIQPVI
jgi:hypothetical protein